MDLEEKFQEALNSLQLKSFMNLKTSRNPNPTTLRLGCALVGLFFSDLAPKSAEDQIFEENGGLNSELYNFYYAEPVKLFRALQASEDIIESQSIPVERIKFAKVLLKDMKEDVLAGTGSIGEAVRNIYNFMIAFLQIYLYRGKMISGSQRKICEIFISFFKVYYPDFVELNFRVQFLDSELMIFKLLHQNYFFKFKKPKF